MIGLLQRVTGASVEVFGSTIARIDRGLLVLVGIERRDDEGHADRLVERMLRYRIFPDAEGRMNRSVVETGGALLVVPQFTLVADTAQGLRPGFSRAADPARARTLFDYLVTRARAAHSAVEAGEFGADMQVALVNDGPATFWLSETSEATV